MSEHQGLGRQHGRPVGWASLGDVVTIFGKQQHWRIRMVTRKLTEPPGNKGGTFLDFPFTSNLDDLQADFAVLGIPFGMPYDASSIANDQSTAPDIIRQTPTKADIEYTKNHFDWDLGGHLFAGKDIKVVDCGNVCADSADHTGARRCTS